MNPTSSTFIRIILAVDSSEHARAAARFVCDLPLPSGSEVTVLAVLTPRHTPGRVALLAALDEARALLPHGGVKVQTGLLHGHPAEALTDYGHEHQPDLMVVGAKGQRATLNILLGGVAQQVVEHAQWPVLVVRAPYTGLRRVLLVTDGSPHSQRALDYLAQFPLPAATEVPVMHVLPPMPEATWPTYLGGFDRVPPPLPDDDVQQRLARQAKAEEREGQLLLARTIEVLHAHRIEARPVLVRGDAATEILQHVQAHPTDLIVVGSRGLSAVKGWWLGSVSRKLVHYAGCSVLIVRGQSQPEN